MNLVAKIEKARNMNITINAKDQEEAQKKAKAWSTSSTRRS